MFFVAYQRPVTCYSPLCARTDNGQVGRQPRCYNTALFQRVFAYSCVFWLFCIRNATVNALDWIIHVFSRAEYIQGVYRVGQKSTGNAVLVFEFYCYIRFICNFCLLADFFCLLKSFFVCRCK